MLRSRTKKFGVLAVALAAAAGVGAAATALVLATTNPAIVRGGQLGARAFYANNYVTGNAPGATAFDGANVWTANFSSNNLTKLNASTGALVGTYPVGVSPRALLFDGSAIWAVSQSKNTVTKINAATLAVIGTYAVGLNPHDALFDGSSVWVSNSSSSNVTKLDPATGAVIGTYAVGAGASRMATDGANVWVVAIGAGNVTKLNAATGGLVGAYPIGNLPGGIAFEQGGFSTNVNQDLDPRSYMWIATGNAVVRVDTATGAIVATYPTGGQPGAPVFDGTNMWVPAGGSNYITKFVVR